MALYKKYLNLKNLKNIRYSTFETAGQRARLNFSKKVFCIETGKTYDSMVIASKELDILHSDVSRSARAGTQIKGYTFIKV